MPTATNPAEFRFRATFNPERKAVRFAGPGGFFDAVLLKGSLGGLIGFGFGQLSRPSGLLGRVRRGNWTITVPHRTKFHPGVPAKPHPEMGTYRNMQNLRRILMIEGPEVAVLRFAKPIPRELVYALKVVFEGASYSANLIPGVHSPSNQQEDESDGTGQQDLEEGQPAAAGGV